MTNADKNPKWNAAHSDQYKALFDFYKHLSTLMTGSILLVATFLEKLFKAPRHTWSVGAAIGALFVSLIAILIAYFVSVTQFPRPDVERPGPFDSGVMSITTIGGLASFLVGIGLLAYFFVWNWFGW